MKYLFFMLLSLNFMFASVFYAKLEPVQSYKVKAAVNGKVIYSNEEIEGKKANNTVVIKLDSFVDEIDLKQTQNKLKDIQTMIDIENKNYNRMKKYLQNQILKKMHKD